MVDKCHLYGCWNGSASWVNVILNCVACRFQLHSCSRMPRKRTEVVVAEEDSQLHGLQSSVQLR